MRDPKLVPWGGFFLASSSRFLQEIPPENCAFVCPIVSVSRGVLAPRELGEVLCTVATRSQAPSPSPRSREALERETDALLWRGTKYAGDADACMLMCKICLEEANEFTAKEIKLFITRLGMS